MASLRARPPALLLTDAMMPVQDGFELLAALIYAGERVAEGDLLRVVAGNQHVGFADAERFAVELLTE